MKLVVANARWFRNVLVTFFLGKVAVAVTLAQMKKFDSMKAMYDGLDAIMSRVMRTAWILRGDMIGTLCVRSCLIE